MTLSHGPSITVHGMAVFAGPAKNVPFPANVLDVDLRAGAPRRAGSYLYEGDELAAPWHSHAMHEIQYAFEGIAEVESVGARHLLRPGQAMWIPAGLPHRTALRGVRALAVLFDSVMVQGADDRVRVLAVAPLLREMLDHAIRWPIDRAESDPTADSFFETFALLVNDWLDQEAALCLPTSADPLVRAVMDHTQEHLAYVKVADVCQAVGLSERTLRRRFADAVGMTWREYLLQSRLLRAMVILAESDRTVLAVATEVGFASVSAFTRVFRRVAGETPSAYRRRTSTPSRSASSAMDRQNAAS
jgi:AraC-like DNA-binding protein/mannose-6-phosphate isomerase-like protein (cupin superfamily)